MKRKMNNKMIKNLFKSVAVVCALAITGVSSAGVIVSQAVDESLFAPAASSADVNVDLGFNVADDFMLSATTAVTKITFWSNTLPGVVSNDLFAVNIYANDGNIVQNSPLWGSQLAGDSISTVSTAVDTLFMHTVEVSNLMLSSGAYMLNIGATLDNQAPMGWARAVGDINPIPGEAQYFISSLTSGGLVEVALQNSVNFAFRIEGDVQSVNAPATIILSLLVFAGLITRRKAN